MAVGRPPQKALAIWCAAYLLSLPFQAVWELPYVGSKVQPPELVFLAGLPLLFRQFGKASEWRQADTALLLLPFVLLVSFAANPGRSAILEVLGLGYLFGVYWLFRSLARHSGRSEIAIAWFSCLLIGISVVSFLFAVSGMDAEGMLSEWKWFPFLGYLPRISGTAPSSNLWASLLAFAGFYYWVYLRRNEGQLLHYLLLAGLEGSYLFTFSKSVFLVLGMLLLWDSPYWRYKKAVRACGMIIILAGLILTHLLPIPNGNRPERISYLPEANCLQLEKMRICPTTYLLLKRKAVDAVIRQPCFGLGGGSFQQWLENEKHAGRYPAETPAYDPHSTYFGLTAEAGLPGLLALIYLILVLYRQGYPQSWLGQAAGLYIALMAVEALSMDILNFRALWISLGIFIGLQTPHEKRHIT